MSIEEIIKKAYQDGAFDNLEGQGKPQDLRENPFVPKELRAHYKILANAGIVPEEVKILHTIAELREKLAHTIDANEQRALRTEISQAESLFKAKVAKLGDAPVE